MSKRSMSYKIRYEYLIQIGYKKELFNVIEVINRVRKNLDIENYRMFAHALVIVSRPKYFFNATEI